jgi:farnesol dehydrogenase
MCILLTGATGFIGTHLVRFLVARGEAVRVLCRPTADLTSLTDRKVEIFWGDILNVASVERAISGCDRVFHLAGYARNWDKDPHTFVTVNVRGLKNVLEAALKVAVKKVVFTSSSVTFGPSNPMVVTESVTRTAEFFTEYEHSKFLAEESVRHYLQAGLNVVIVNPTRVFGPGLLNEGNSVTMMIQLYLQGKWRLVLGDGRGMGNYAFVHDVVKGHVAAMERGAMGEKYLLGGENVSYNEFFEMLAELSKRKYRLFHVPPSLALAVSQLEKFRAEWFGHYPLITPGWVRTFLADWAFSCAKAERDLGYKITLLREALDSTVKWLDNHNQNSR